MDEPPSLPNSQRPSSRDGYLQHRIEINKQSHKIGKSALTPLIPPSASASTDQDHPHHRPPVYTVDKNDFRLVVQRLTGSVPSERVPDSPPPPIRPPKPPSSRLQRIKPPPLAPIARTPTGISPNQHSFLNHPELPAGMMSPKDSTYGNPLGLIHAPMSPTMPGIGLLPLPLSPSQIPLLSPTCSMQMRSPQPRLPVLSPNSNVNQVDSLVPFSPSSPWSRILLPSSPGFLRLPVTTSK